MSDAPGFYERRGGFDDRLQRLEVDVAVMKADHVQIKNDMREVRTLLDKSADKQGAIFRAVLATLFTTLTGALGYVVWEILTHPKGFG
jgi:hypothetical protein